MSPRGPAIEGTGESSDRPREDGLARVTELPAGGPHDPASSSSSPAGEHRLPCCEARARTHMATCFVVFLCALLLLAVHTSIRPNRWPSDSWLSL